MYSENPLYKKDFILCRTKSGDIFLVEAYACCNHGASHNHEAVALRNYLEILKWVNIEMHLQLYRDVAELSGQFKPMESWSNPCIQYCWFHQYKTM